MTNKNIGLFLFISFFYTSVFAQQVDTSNTANLSKATTDLYNEIFSADSSLFNAFNNCDTLSYKKFFTDDLEFYHDKGGLTISLKNELQSFTENCKTDLHLRRELVKSSLEIYPIKDYGAIEIGMHRFYHRNKDKIEKLNGTYKFIHIWQKNNGQWKVSRIISYGHGNMKN
jgi:ketosteroid isomerase-like protein